ncbi:unnamed protein product [Cuscuta europaea]|uniref:Uncharacterized protein n=1 Tax=Cuscuta europaea TaxID=41803 RepID=A0A9P0YZT0_CUSEU|nr:unnamed protein product [Cuscuta europaea]
MPNVKQVTPRAETLSKVSPNNPGTASPAIDLPSKPAAPAATLLVTQVVTTAGAQPNNAAVRTSPLGAVEPVFDTQPTAAEKRMQSRHHGTPCELTIKFETESLALASQLFFSEFQVGTGDQ